MLSNISKADLIASFANFDQTELPTRKELQTLKTDEIKKSHRIRMIPKNTKKPSKQPGHNLNLRIVRADKLWKNTWMGERGTLLRHVGVQYPEEITALADMVECPQVVVDFFVNTGGL